MYLVPEISHNIVEISMSWTIFLILIQIGLWIGVVNIILASVALIIKIKSSIKYHIISLVTTFFIEYFNVSRQWLGGVYNYEVGLLHIALAIILLIIQIIIFIKLIKEIKKKRRESKDVKNRK